MENEKPNHDGSRQKLWNFQASIKTQYLTPKKLDLHEENWLSSLKESQVREEGFWKSHKWLTDIIIMQAALLRTNWVDDRQFILQLSWPIRQLLFAGALEKANVFHMQKANPDRQGLISCLKFCRIFWQKI